MITEPCAMKTIRMVPKIRLSPMAAMPYMVPTRIPLTTACIVKSNAEPSLFPFSSSHSTDIGFTYFLVREEIVPLAAHDNPTILNNIGIMG